MHFWIQYQNISDAVSSRLPLFSESTQFSKVIEADNLQIDDFLFDLPDAHNRPNALDTKIVREASALFLKYVDLVWETMGSMEFVAGNAKNSGSDIKIFMKDIGVNGYVFPSPPLILSTQPYRQLRESCQCDVYGVSCIVVYSTSTRR